MMFNTARRNLLGGMRKNALSYTPAIEVIRV